MKTPLITVVTVTYNLIKAGRKETFLQMLKSVKAQDYPNIEHLVIDGNSCDGTKELFDELEVNYISEPDSGLFDAMNKGAKLAKGEYCIFLNSDDFYHDSRGISSYVTALNRHQVDFVCSKVFCLSEETPALDMIFYTDFSEIFRKMPLPHPSLLCKTEILRKYPFDLKHKIVGDYDFVMKLFLYGYKGVALEDCFVSFRMGGMSDTRQAHVDDRALRKAYLPYKKQIMQNIPEEFNKSHPFLSVLTVIPRRGNAEKSEACTAFYNSQSYPYMEHLFVEEEGTYSQSLQKALTMAKGDYIYILPYDILYDARACDAYAFEKMIQALTKKKVQAVYANFHTLANEEVHTNNGSLNKNFLQHQKKNLVPRKHFLENRIPTQAFIYRKDLFQYANLGVSAFDEFLFHNRLFVEQGMAYAYVDTNLPAVKKGDIIQPTESQRKDFAERFSAYLSKPSPYDKIKVKSRIKLFNTITLVRIVENMWEKKYYLLGLFCVKTVKK